jgi:NAD(P)-dependent dehydrogenase (short-subunit alcohol dehydrogenase family)
MAKKVWFITGCSTGFGRALAQRTLELGYPTVCTARNRAQVEDLVLGHESNGLALELDVTRPEQITAAVQAAVERFGTIDVLVNNAGIGYFGSLEESDLAEVRRMFEINVWGLAQATRTVLPLMRARKSGTIVNISSVAGIAASPALSFYNASKFAVEGLSESLAQEVAPLGIKVLLVEPGPFRTDWAGRSAAEAPDTLEDYRETASAGLKRLRGRNGRQPGDPARAAVAIIQTVEAQEPPLRLLLGKFALANARLKVVALQKDFEGWAKVSEAADFPADQA